jgi:hypothetical protein
MALLDLVTTITQEIGYLDEMVKALHEKSLERIAAMRKQFEEVLIANSEKTMLVQKQALQNTYNNWKGDLEQVDDVCVVGIRV